MADDKKSDWDEVHRQALEEYERDYERERHNINDAYEDLKFRRGRLEDQGPSSTVCGGIGRKSAFKIIARS
ncbi:hypothetical protein [Bradyrhizobium sp. CCBAU 51753]|uniref:hypothetical protein n=1 Tax=Bradyrhizobium sp. CCBAU 51753 TaxID=1325100 RepID=UPI00188A5C9B|nr:hypothetical protein [Bradyrhizobium sp. CCBAU 51753]QOZ24099.1 hypothetical protein XH93_11330 [Bradyrhizobium sp. CCBAU 51753]